MAKEIILKDKDGGQLLPVTTTEQVKREGGSKTLEDNILELENLVPLAEAYGATYDSGSGLFSLNGLTDITGEQMKDIIGKGVFHGADGNFKYTYLGVTDIRTNIVTSSGNDHGYNNPIYMNYGFCRCRQIEHASLRRGDYIVYVKNLNSAFYECANLKRVVNNLVELNVEDDCYYQTFYSCKSLEHVYISKLSKSVSFKDSPLLSYDSLKFLVDNAANTDPITVTVHGDVYAKLSGTASEYGDHTQEEWTAIMTAATEKQISFATE